MKPEPQQKLWWLSVTLDGPGRAACSLLLLPQAPEVLQGRDYCEKVGLAWPSKAQSFLADGVCAYSTPAKPRWGVAKGNKTAIFNHPPASLTSLPRRPTSFPLAS